MAEFIALRFSFGILSQPPKIPFKKQEEPRPMPAAAEPIKPAAMMGSPRLERDLSAGFIAGKSSASYVFNLCKSERARISSSRVSS